jgi:hypothetical protein
MAKASPPRGVASAEFVTAVLEVDMVNYWMLQGSGAIRLRKSNVTECPSPHPFLFKCSFQMYLGCAICDCSLYEIGGRNLPEYSFYSAQCKSATRFGLSETGRPSPGSIEFQDEKKRRRAEREKESENPAFSEEHV